MDLGLTYKGALRNVDAFADASLGSAEGGFSVTGYIVRVYGDPVLWRTKKQKLPASSSSEAEYFSLSTCSKDTIITVGLLERLTKRNYRPAIIFGDNRPSIAQAKTPGAPKLKHVENLNYHYVRDMVSRKNVELRWVGSAHQLADTFTKALAAGKFLEFRKGLLNE